MTAMLFPRILRLTALSVLGGLTLAGAFTVRAQTTPPASATPFSYGISETVTHDSNLFRDVQGAEESEWLSATALNFGLDQALGRQRLLGKASLLLNRYRYHSELNNTGHDLSLELDWETVASLSGAVGVQAQRQQYRYGLDSEVPFDGRNIESTELGFARARWGGMGEWSLMLGGNALHRSYSADAFAANELTQWSVDAGGGYQPSPDLGFTLLARHTDVARPDVAGLAGDDFNRDDIEWAAQWQATGASRFEALLARSSEKHALIADSSYWNGSLGWNWAPSAKLKFSTKVLRDSAGNSGSPAAPGGDSIAARAGSQLRDAFVWTAAWDVTPKISFDAGAQWSRRKLRGLLGGAAVSAEDRTTALSLGARYAVSRALDLRCNLLDEKRDTDTTDIALTRPYDAMAVQCAVQFWVR
jgi:hypothetical protein